MSNPETRSNSLIVDSWDWIVDRANQVLWNIHLLACTMNCQQQVKLQVIIVQDKINNE